MEVRSVVRWISYTLHELYNEEGRKLNDSGGGLMGSLETNDALPLLRRTLLLLRDERNIQWMLFGEYYSVNIIQWALFTESQWAESQWIPSLFASFVQRKIVQYHYVLAVSANIRRSSWTSQPHVYWVSDFEFQTRSETTYAGGRIVAANRAYRDRILVIDEQCHLPPYSRNCLIACLLFAEILNQNWTQNRNRNRKHHSEPRKPWIQREDLKWASIRN